MEYQYTHEQKQDDDPLAGLKRKLRQSIRFQSKRMGDYTRGKRIIEDTVINAEQYDAMIKYLSEWVGI